MLEVDGKKYRLEEAYAIPEHEVAMRYGHSWGEPNWHEVDLARKDVEVKKCLVLVEVDEQN